MIKKVSELAKAATGDPNHFTGPLQTHQYIQAQELSPSLVTIHTGGICCGQAEPAVQIQLQAAQTIGGHRGV